MDNVNAASEKKKGIELLTKEEKKLFDALTEIGWCIEWQMRRTDKDLGYSEDEDAIWLHERIEEVRESGELTELEQACAYIANWPDFFDTLDLYDALTTYVDISRVGGAVQGEYVGSIDGDEHPELFKVFEDLFGMPYSATKVEEYTSGWLFRICDLGDSPFNDATDWRYAFVSPHDRAPWDDWNQVIWFSDEADAYPHGAIAQARVEYNKRNACSDENVEKYAWELELPCGAIKDLRERVVEHSFWERQSGIAYEIEGYKITAWYFNDDVNGYEHVDGYGYTPWQAVCDVCADERFENWFDDWKSEHQSEIEGEED